MKIITQDSSIILHYILFIIKITIYTKETKNKLKKSPEKVTHDSNRAYNNTNTLSIETQHRAYSLHLTIYSISKAQQLYTKSHSIVIRWHLSVPLKTSTITHSAKLRLQKCKIIILKQSVASWFSPAPTARVATSAMWKTGRRDEASTETPKASRGWENGEGVSPSPSD